MAWYNGSWNYRVAITVDSAEVDSNLTDFPVYVDLSDLPAGFHTNVKSDGGDIRVTTSDETTEVPREVVFYDAGTDTGELHFKAPSLSSTVDTTFYIYYGNSGASDYATSATYGAENVWTEYEAVWHMQEDPSGTAPQIVDSTGGGYDLTSTGSMTSGDSVTATIGKGIDFDGSNDKLTVSSDPYVGSAGEKMWISAIISGLPANDDNTIVGFGSFFSFQAYIGDLIIVSNGDNSGVSVAAASVDDGGTYFVTGYYNQGNEYRIYKNGSEVVQKNTTDTQASDGTIQVGEQNGASRLMDGIMDEVRWAMKDLGADWVSAEYTNQNTPTTFYTVGTQESGATTSTSSSTSTTVSTSTSTTISTSTSTSSTSTSTSVSTSTTTVPPEADYTYEDIAVLPVDSTNLGNAFNDTQYGQVLNNDDIYFDLAAQQIATKLFKWDHTNNSDEITVTWRGKTTHAPTTSTVFLQIYNYNSASWETLDSDNTTSADTEFILTGEQTTSLSNYYNGVGNTVSARVYQEIA